MIKRITMSNLHRPMVCAGSLFFTDLPEQPFSESAAEGIAAGEYLESLLTNKPVGSHASNGVEFTEEMMYHAVNIANNIKGKAQGDILCETRVDWMSAGDILLTGKYDASFVRDDTLYIDDLKYGYGLVEVKDNWQLLAYAIGEVIRLGKVFKKIVLRIHQPRAHHEDGATRAWELSYSELIQYKEKIDARLNKIAMGLEDLETGSQCKYCPAASACPALNKAYHRGVEIVHEFVQDEMDNYELSYQLDLISRIEDIVKTRKGSLELLASTRIAKGDIIPNYISANSYGHRSWKSNITAEGLKLLTGLDLTEAKLISPAQAERKGLSKDVTAMVTERKTLPNKLKRKDSTKEGNQIFGPQEPTLKGV